MRAVVVAGLVVALTGTARADLFEEASADFAAQRYDQSIAKYEQLVSQGHRHENLYYDLGNAYFRAGRLGRAILNYERAIRYAPEDDDIRYNLQVARDAVAAKFGKDTVVGATEDPFWVRAAHWLPLRTLGWGFLLLDVLFFAVLIALRFLSTGFVRTGLVVANVFVAAAAVALGGFLALQLYYVTQVRAGIVVDDEVEIREGPDTHWREMDIKLHAGHRLVVVRRTDAWARIRLANRVEGWVPRSSVEEI